MNVFVLGTGRCGTKTFSVACSHLTNFTSGHETRVKRVGDRLDYPDQHIEADPRLAWHLGELAIRFPEARYVHLVRDQVAVERSILRRWGTSRFLRTLRTGLLNRSDRSYRTLVERQELVALYVRMVTTNIWLFAGTRPVMLVRLEHAKEQFPLFLEWIGAKGDLAAACSEWDRKYNASRGAR